MEPGIVPLPILWLLALLLPAVLGYVAYQFRGYQLLRQQNGRLQTLRAGQRHVYRSLESCQDCCQALFVRVPNAVRASPYTADDERAIELRGQLAARLDGLRGRLRALQVGASPGLAPLTLLSGRYWREVETAGRELEFAESQRREVAQVEALVDELEAVLARLAHKPQEVRQAFADLQATAESLSDEIAQEQQSGTEGLVALVFEARGVRASALDWVQRLDKAPAAEADRTAIEAEALRPQLVARLNELYARVSDVTGIHGQAQRGLERLAAALEAMEGRLAGLRPPLAEALRPALNAWREQREVLNARYGAHNVAAYREVSAQAWALVAKARSTDREYARVAEADRRATGIVEACRKALGELQRQMEEERSKGRAELDRSQAALVRAQGLAEQMESVLAQGIGSGQVADLAVIMDLLGGVEAHGASCRQELLAGRESLLAWQAQRKRAEEVLSRVATAAADHRRVTRAWEELQAYHPANWTQLKADWYTQYVQEEQDLVAAGEALQERLKGGRIRQSEGDDLRRQCDVLHLRWQQLLHENQRLTAALGRARAAERQAQEAIAALQGELQAAAAMEQELLPTLPGAEEVRRLLRETLDRHQQLTAQARTPDRTDFFRLGSEGIAGLRELLEMRRLSYAQLVENERAGLRRRLAQLWEQWEPLQERLAKASPASEVDRRGLADRWEALLQGARAGAAGLGDIQGLAVQAEQFGRDVGAALAAFQGEREAVRRGEVGLARERRAAAHVRDNLARLLGHRHPQVVDEEWERSTKAWRRGEGMLRRLEPKRGIGPYLERLAEAEALYREARARAHSSLVRLLRYAFLEDPEGMHQACLPMGRRWGRIGVTARDSHIRELLDELEQAGQLGRLVERVGGYLGGRGSDTGG